MNIRTLTATPKAIAFRGEEIKRAKTVKQTSTRVDHARLNQLLGLDCKQVRNVVMTGNGYRTIYFTTNKSAINNVLIPHSFGDSIGINYLTKRTKKRPKNVAIQKTDRFFSLSSADLTRKGIISKARKAFEHLRQLALCY